MVDVWLVILTVIFSIICVGISLFIFLLFTDWNEEATPLLWIGRAVVVFNILLVVGFLATIPLDISNSRLVLDQQLNVNGLQKILLILLFVTITTLTPFFLFLYESDDEESIIKRILSCTLLYIVIALFILVFSLIAFLSMKEIKIKNDNSTINETIINNGDNSGILDSNNQLSIFVPGYIQIMAFWILIGWFVFVQYLGIGMVALPMDLIMDFFQRPKPVSAVQLAQQKITIRWRLEELIQYIAQLKEQPIQDSTGLSLVQRLKRAKDQQEKINNFKEEYLLVKQEYDLFEEQENFKVNIVVVYLKLILGCFLMIFTFMLMFQLLFYVLIRPNGVPYSQFLNSVLFWLEFSVAWFLALVFLLLIIIYIIGCIFKGNIKFGFRIMFFVPIYLLERNATLLNSFLFNTLLMAISAAPAAHFLSIIFQSYFVSTSTLYILGVVFGNMPFFSWFFRNNIFIYILFGWVLLTFIYLIFKRTKKRLNLEEMFEKRKQLEGVKKENVPLNTNK